jgi:hypothetical protein
MEILLVRNASGKTPKKTMVPTPNIQRREEIQNLLNDAIFTTKRSQTSLKSLVILNQRIGDCANATT